jgi:hypothetical protein
MRRWPGQRWVVFSVIFGELKLCAGVFVPSWWCRFTREVPLLGLVLWSKMCCKGLNDLPCFHRMERGLFWCMSILKKCNSSLNRQLFIAHHYIDLTFAFDPVIFRLEQWCG